MGLTGIAWIFMSVTSLLAAILFFTVKIHKCSHGECRPGPA